MPLIKRISVFAVCILTVLFTLISASAQGQIVVDIPEESSYDYTETGDMSADTYNVDIDVSENNVLCITEKITMTYSKARHGFYRYIPLYGVINQYSGGESRSHNFRIKVSDVAVQDKDFAVSDDGKTLKITLGNDTETVIGTQYYVLTYKCMISDDKIDSQDIIHWNFIPSDRPYKIKSCTLNITLPKEADSLNPEIFSGKYGQQNTDGFKTGVNGKTVTATLTQGLEPYHGATVNIVLPEGYFSGEYSLDWLWVVVLFIIFVTLILIVLIRFISEKTNGALNSLVKFVSCVLTLVPLSAVAMCGLHIGAGETKSYIVFFVFTFFMLISEICAVWNFGKRKTMSALRKAALIGFPMAVSVIAFAVMIILTLRYSQQPVIAVIASVITILEYSLSLSMKSKKVQYDN